MKELVAAEKTQLLFRGLFTTSRKSTPNGRGFEARGRAGEDGEETGGRGTMLPS